MNHFIYNSVSLSVPPVVKINAPRLVIATKGRPVNITCSASGFPVPKVVWQKSSNYITTLASTDTSGLLHFESVQVSWAIDIKNTKKVVLI